MRFFGIDYYVAEPVIFSFNSPRNIFLMKLPLVKKLSKLALKGSLCLSLLGLSACECCLSDTITNTGEFFDHAHGRCVFPYNWDHRDSYFVSDYKGAHSHGHLVYGAAHHGCWRGKFTGGIPKIQWEVEAPPAAPPTGKGVVPYK